MTNTQNILDLVRPYVGPLSVLLGAALAGLITKTLLQKIELRVAKFHSHLFAQILAGIHRPVVLAVPIIIVLDRLEMLDLPVAWSNEIERLLLCVLDVLAALATLAFLRVITSGVVARYRSDSGLGPDPQVATRVSLIATISNVIVWLIALASGLLIFPEVRSLGATLLASAGLVGIIAGLAMRPILENLIAGIQLALAQPLRLDDVIVVNNEHGVVEEITATYIVIRCWDGRRLVYPLTFFIANPFENWTRRPTDLLGTVMLYIDRAEIIDPLRKEFQSLIAGNSLWSGGIAKIEVIESDHLPSIKLRVLVSASTPAKLWELRTAVREHLLTYLEGIEPAEGSEVAKALT